MVTARYIHDIFTICAATSLIRTQYRQADSIAETHVDVRLQGNLRGSDKLQLCRGLASDSLKRDA